MKCIKLKSDLHWKVIEVAALPGIIEIQECIPVGCVPPACWPYPSMHCRGVPARGVPAQGGVPAREGRVYLRVGGVPAQVPWTRVGFKSRSTPTCFVSFHTQKWKIQNHRLALNQVFHLNVHLNICWFSIRGNLNLKITWQCSNIFNFQVTCCILSTSLSWFAWEN